MVNYLEQVAMALQVMKLADEADLSGEERSEVKRIARCYIEACLSTPATPSGRRGDQ